MRLDSKVRPAENAMFLKNCWYVAAWSDQLPVGGIHALSIINEPVVLYRAADGTLVALEDRCCHRSAPLSKGRLEDGCNLRCMYHGLKFDPTGLCIEIPGQDKIPPGTRVRAFPVIERHSWIWVWMGEAQKADPTLIPKAHGLDDPKYIMRHGQIDYDVDYQLVNDNLTDFSHLSFVHANSFRATEMWARARPRVQVIDRGIRVSRWMPSAEAFTDVKAVGLVETDVQTAVYQAYDYLVPGILIMVTATYRLEEMPADRVSASSAEPISATYTSQAITPMGERKTRYFWLVGPPNVEGGAQIADELYKSVEMAFEEDQVMIEAQQKVLDLGSRPQMLTGADVGPVQMRAVLRKMCLGEVSGEQIVPQDGSLQTARAEGSLSTSP
jgi:vanillate O-demethylase monooxygenase subunit